MSEALAPDIHGGLKRVLESKKKLIPQHVNRISAMDDPCLRRLYYMRHDWDMATVPEDGLQGIFETGSILEPVIERIVSEVGHASVPMWRIVGSQMTTNDRLLRDYQISGTTDGFLQVRDDAADRWVTLGAIDIKTMNPNIFGRVTDYESLGRYAWTRKYRGQVMLYSLAHDMDRCFLLLVNKSNLYDMRLIDFAVDLEYCEGLLQKAKAVNEALANGTQPERVEDTDDCPRCPFYSYCAPDVMAGSDLTIAESEELAAVLDRLDELAPTDREIKALEDERDGLLVKGQNVICGRWIVTWKQDVKGHWRKKIVKAQ